MISATRIIYAVVIVRPGTVRGEQEIRIDALSSTGEMVQQWRDRWNFTDEVGGGQALVDLTILVRHEGTMRWDVYLNDRLLTRMPLRVVLLRRAASNGQQPEAWLRGLPR